jgi:hypothetical protein
MGCNGLPQNKLGRFPKREAAKNLKMAFGHGAKGIH